MEPQKFIARFRDGRTVKGTTFNFSPQRASFHLLPLAAGPGERPVIVDVCDLKAIFIVHSFEGNPQYEERKHMAEGEVTHGRAVRVEFEDGEELVGTTTNYNPEDRGFFVHPIDPHSNNRSVFVVRSAVKKLDHLKPEEIQQHIARSA